MFFFMIFVIIKTNNNFIINFITNLEIVKKIKLSIGLIDLDKYVSFVLSV
jgi:hypothetical protein